MTDDWSLDDTWSLLAPSDTVDVDPVQCSGFAERFLDATLTFAPDSDRVTVVRTRNSERVAEVRYRSIAGSESVMLAANAAVIAMGGAGFDVLVARTQRIWQVQARPVTGPERCGPGVFAAVLAMRFMAPVLMPRGERIFGVKGTREWLAANGWS